MPKVASTEFDHAEHATVDAQSFSHILQSLGDIVWYLDANRQFRFCNTAFETFTGYKEHALFGLRPPYQGRPLSGFIRDFMAEPRDCRSAPIEVGAPHPKTGRDMYFELRELVVRDEDGAVAGYACIATDISARKSMELELKASRHALFRQAYYDTLTGLPNRTHFMGIAPEMISGLVDEGGCGAFLLIDLDRFASVNDMLGHVAADSVLIELTDRLREEADRAGDYLARLSSDEFLLIRKRVKEGQDEDDLSRDCTALLAGLSKPLFSERRLLAVTASMGVSLFPEHGRSAEDLLRRAHSALHAAKRGGQQTWRIFDSSLCEEARERFALETDLQRSLATDDFTIHYQAKVDLASGAIVGAEALVRWNHPAMGSIPPSVFIPLAEETGLIIPLGERILTDACRFARLWNESSHAVRRVSVNLAPRQVLLDDFPPLLEACLARTGCRPEWLELDMTEHLLMSDEKRVDTLMQWLHTLGVKVAIDDLGPGHSAISSLTDAPVATVKIDRSLVAAAAAGGREAALVRSIAGMARELGITCLAEGIERAEVAALMRASGCDEGQGFFWNRPVPQAEFLAWAAERA